MRDKERIAKLKKEAVRYRTKQKYRQAAGAYRRLTELDPINPTWPHKLGQVLQHMGKADQATDALEKAAENYLNKGFVLKAIAMCKMILELSPDNTRIQETLLLLHERNPRPRRTDRQTQLQQPEQQPGKEPKRPRSAKDIREAARAAAAAEARSAPPEEPIAPAMAPVHQVMLDPEQLEGEPEPPITPVDTGQILSAEDAAIEAPLMDIAMPAAPATKAPPLEIAPEARAPEEAPPAEEEAPPAEEEPPEAGARRRRSPDTLENIPLAVALPDVRPAAHAAPAEPVYEVPLEEVWIDIDMDDDGDEEDQASEELLQRLPHVPLLSSLSTDELRSFIDRVSVEQYQEGDVIISQDAWGDTLYILVQGTVGVFTQGADRVVTLGMHGEGTFFGEYALLTNLRHTASVEAMDDCTVLCVSRRVVRELLEEHPPMLKVLLGFFRERLIQNLTANHMLFQPFSTAERSALVRQFHFLEAPPNRVLVREGQRPDGLYLLVCGEATVHRSGAPSSDLVMGEMFCKTALLTRTVSSNTVRTASKCWLLWMPRQIFGEVIMTHPQVLATIAEAKVTGRLTVDELGLDDHEETLAVV